MKTKLRLAIFATLFFIILNSCKKNDFPHLPGVKDCDYATATSNYLDLFSDNFGFIDSPLFVKHYDANSLHVNSISAHFQNVAGGFDQAQDLSLQYAGSHTYFFTPEAYSLITLNYNTQGKLVTAIAPNDMEVLYIYDSMHSLKYEYKFNYASDKLVSVDSRVDNTQPWQPHIKFYYDAAYTNVIKIDYYYNNAIEGTATFKYDLNKFVTNSYYPDQNIGPPWYFFAFLQYLNTFPELHPKNLLLSYHLKTRDYPYHTDSKYSHHTFDATGKLTGYDVNAQIKIPDYPVEHWNIQWNCCDIFPKISY